MRKYAGNSIALILTVASFVTVASGCSKVQSKSANDSAQTGQSSSASSQDQNSQTVEGCVVKRETAYYIQPATGDQMRVSSSGQDLSANVGQHVRATGTSSTNTQSSTSGGMSGTQSSSTGTSGSSSSNEPELLVTKVDVVAQSCPPDIQNRIDKQNRSKNPK
ncbi:MAG: hypothetical protein JWO13_3604 [Acidobacteriales bacterium]|nr:hypothetical protein [Terriglobales bacterium]